MNSEGLRAFEAAHREHMERPTYSELYRLISEKAREHGMQCRLDALHFLALNFEFMVAEPLGHQRSGTMAAIMRGDVRDAVEKDLDTLFDGPALKSHKHSLDSQSPNSKGATFDPSRDESEYGPSGISSGKMLKEVAKRYNDLHISRWRLWG